MSRRYRILALAIGAALVMAVAPTGEAQDGPFQFYSLTPCRAVDTRISTQSSGGYGPIITTKVERKFPIQGNCNVPVGATAVALNVTVVTPTNQGSLTLYPAGIAEPLVSTITFPLGTYALANGAIVPLANQSLQPKDLAAKFTLCGSTTLPCQRVLNNGQAHLALDVTGYFK
jgi:hypothetical protein